MTRTPFTTSRLLEFTSIPELTRLIGADVPDWPLVAVKELIDNGLDAAEESEIAPEIGIAISTAEGTISVTDNGAGMAADTVTRLLDYQSKTSSREAYVSPSRGQQGNALQALLAMPFALDGTTGRSTIEARGIAHAITFGIDPIRRVPTIGHEQRRQRRSSVQFGTRVTLQWPNSASSQLVDAKARIVSLVRDFSWLNPHAAFTLRWDHDILVAAKATNPEWRKWRPDDPAPAYWYDAESFSRLIAACVADDLDHERDRTVRDFVAEFRGLARTDVRAQVLNSVGVARMGLREFFEKPNVTELLGKPDEIEFLLDRRVELNAMTSRQLVDFVERKLVESGVRKIVPKAAELADAFRLFARGHEAEKVIRRELKKLDGGAQVIVPRDLAPQVKDYLDRHPAKRWDEAVAAIVKRPPGAR